MKTLDQILEGLPEERRQHIEARAEELILEEHALRRLRKARKLTQEHMAELLGVRQDSISRLERRSDLLLSTLRGYIEAMGGSLQLLVKFDDDQAVPVRSFVDIEDNPRCMRAWTFARPYHDPVQLVVSCSGADIANTNFEQWAINGSFPPVVSAPPQAAFGPVLVYRYDAPPHHKARDREGQPAQENAYLADW